MAGIFNLADIIRLIHPGALVFQVHSSFLKVFFLKAAPVNTLVSEHVDCGDSI